MCTLIQMGPWKSVLIIKVSTLLRYRGLNAANYEVSTIQVFVNTILSTCIVT